MAIAVLNADGTVARYDEQIAGVFPTLDALKNFPPVNNPDWTGDGTLAILIGGSAPHDQPIQMFAWDPAETTAGNDTTIVQPTAIEGSDPGRWVSPS